MDLNGSYVPQNHSDFCHYQDTYGSYSAALIIFFFVNLLLNLPVLLLVAVNRRVQEVRNVYTAALAAADTLVSFNGLLALMWVREPGLKERVWLCTFFKVYLYSTLCCSLITLLLVSIDRLLYIRFPFYYICNMTRVRAAALTAFSWLSTVAYVLVMRFLPPPTHRYCNGHCDAYTMLYQSDNFALVNSAVFFMMFFIPFLAHILIWRSAIAQAKKLSKGRPSLGDNLSVSLRRFSCFSGFRIYKKSVSSITGKYKCHCWRCMIKSPVGNLDSTSSQRVSPSAERPVSYSDRYSHSAGSNRFPAVSPPKKDGANTISNYTHPVPDLVHITPSTPDITHQEESKATNESCVQFQTGEPTCMDKSVSDTIVKRRRSRPRSKCFMIISFKPAKRLNRCTRKRVSNSNSSPTSGAISKENSFKRAMRYSATHLKRHIPILKIISPANSSGSTKTSSYQTHVTKLERPRVQSILKNWPTSLHASQPDASSASLLTISPAGADCLDVPAADSQLSVTHLKARGSISSRVTLVSNTSTYFRSKLAELKVIRFRVARKLLGVFVSLSLFWLPLIVLGLMGPQRASPFMLLMVGYLALLNSTANALVYAWSDVDMRTAMRETICRSLLHCWMDRARVGIRNSSSPLEWGRESRVTGMNPGEPGRSGEGAGKTDLSEGVNSEWSGRYG